MDAGLTLAAVFVQLVTGALPSRARMSLLLLVKSLFGLEQWDLLCPLWRGVICEAIGALEPWESAAEAFEACFLGVALVEPPPWLLSPPPPLLGLLSEPVADSYPT